MLFRDEAIGVYAFLRFNAADLFMAAGNIE